jgi:hypothetical protein
MAATLTPRFTVDLKTHGNLVSYIELFKAWEAEQLGENVPVRLS